MKNRTEKTTKENSAADKKSFMGPLTAQKSDETYLHVNKSSFQQNFKALIGHYKTKEASVII